MSFILSFRNILESLLKTMLKTKKIFLKRLLVALVMLSLITITIIYIIW
jgi:hypothetical protein